MYTVKQALDAQLIGKSRFFLPDATDEKIEAYKKQSEANDYLGTEFVSLGEEITTEEKYLTLRWCWAMEVYKTIKDDPNPMLTKIELIGHIVEYTSQEQENQRRAKLPPTVGVDPHFLSTDY